MFSPAFNTTDDKYGGSLEKRMRLGVEVVAAIRHEVGPTFPIFYRHTAEAEGYGVAESVQFCNKLIAAGVSVLDISPSFRGEAHAAIAAEVKAGVNAPVIAVGGMDQPEQAETALREGKCDLCAVGRQLIADADWPRKLAEGREAEIIACTKCNLRCYGHLREGIPIGCEENPRSGNEYRMV